MEMFQQCESPLMYPHCSVSAVTLWRKLCWKYQENILLWSLLMFHWRISCVMICYVSGCWSHVRAAIFILQFMIRQKNAKIFIFFYIVAIKFHLLTSTHVFLLRVAETLLTNINMSDFSKLISIRMKFKTLSLEQTTNCQSNAMFMLV